jgi:hypothetical protein
MGLARPVLESACSMSCCGGKIVHLRLPPERHPANCKVRCVGKVPGGMICDADEPTDPAPACMHLPSSRSRMKDLRGSVPLLRRRACLSPRSPGAPFLQLGPVCTLVNRGSCRFSAQTLASPPWALAVGGTRLARVFPGSQHGALSFHFHRFALRFAVSFVTFAVLDG